MSEPFQIWATQKIETILSDELETPISLHRVEYIPPATLNLHQIYIEDQHQDTLFYIGRAHFNLLYSFIGNNENGDIEITLPYAHLDSTIVKFINYPEGMSGDFFFAKFEPQDTIKDSIPGPSFFLNIDNLELRHSSFHLFTPNSPAAETSFDPDNFRFNNIYANLKSFSVYDDSLNFITEHLSLEEKGGLKLKKLKAKTIICAQQMSFKELEFETPHSKLGDSLVFTYDHWRTMGYFLDSVVITASIKNSFLNFIDLTHFSNEIKSIPFATKFSGNFYGTIADFKAKNMVIDGGKNTYLEGSISMEGLPNIDKTFMDIALKKSHTTSEDLFPFAGKAVSDFTKNLGQINVDGNFTGFIHDFVAYGTFITDIGEFKSDLNLKLGDEDIENKYSGSFSTQNLNVGRLFDIEGVGEVSLETQINGNGFTLDVFNGSAKGTIFKAEVNGYSLSNTIVSGGFANREFNGNIKIEDQNIVGDFTGLIDFKKDEPQFDFNLYIEKFNLLAFGWDTVESNIQGNIVMDLQGSSFTKLNGSVYLNELSIDRINRYIDLGGTKLTARLNDPVQSIDLESSIIDAGIKGKIDLNELGNSFNEFLNRLFPHNIKAPKSKSAKEDFFFSINLKDFESISDFLLLDYEIGPTQINGHYHSDLNDFTVLVKSKYISYSDYKLNDIKIDLSHENANDELLKVWVKNVTQKDSIKLRNFDADLFISTNQVNYQINLNDSIRSLVVELNGNLNINSFYNYQFTFDSSFISDKTGPIYIKEGNFLNIDSGEVYINNLLLYRDQDSLLLSGVISNSNNAGIDILASDFNLANINGYLNLDEESKLGGIVNGKFKLYNLLKVPTIESDLKIDRFSFGEDTVGDVILESEIDRALNEIWLKGRIINGLFSNLRLDGKVNLAGNNNLNLTLNLDPSELKLIKFFMGDLISNITGTIEGDLRITGSINSPELKGKMLVRSGAFTFDYLKTRYYFSSIIDINNKEFYFNPFSIADENGKTANAFGTLKHDNFSDFDIDFSVENMENFKVLNTTEKDNDLFYGTAYIDGKVRMHGPFEKLNVDIKAKNRANTIIFLPFAGTGADDYQDIIRIVNGNESFTAEAESDLTGLLLNFDLDINRDAELQIIFDKTAGDIMRGRGRGNLLMEINTLGDFRMYGNYIIESGDYNFTALGIISKKFYVAPGSNIQWTGDPINANMNVTAIYKTVASPYNLVSGVIANKTDLEAYRSPIPVNCKLVLRGNLLAPGISFGIEFPDLQSIGNGGGSGSSSALITSIRRLEANQEELNRQIFYLLVTGNFITPAENQALLAGGGSSTGTDAVGNAGSSLLTNQVNQWLSMLNTRWILSMNYQAGNAINPGTMQIIANRKLFNDRLEIGAIYDAANNLGNFSALYKITKDGNLQIKAFNRNTNNLYYNQNIITQGIGLYYRYEFEHMGDFLRLERARREAERKRKEELNKPQIDSLLPQKDSTSALNF